MSIQSYAYQYQQLRKFVSDDGTLTADSRDLLLALINRTGGGTGIVPKVNDTGTAPIVTTGTTIADAVMLTTDWNWVTTVPAGTGVLILPLKPGNDIKVYNGGANLLRVYPFNAQSQINALGPGTPYQLAAGSKATFECWSLTQLFSGT